MLTVTLLETPVSFAISLIDCLVNVNGVVPAE